MSRHARIEDWSDERKDGNSLIVELKRGWKFDLDPYIPNHVAGFDTVRDAMKAVRSSVPCTCDECQPR